VQVAGRVEYEVSQACRSIQAQGGEIDRPRLFHGGGWAELHRDLRASGAAEDVAVLNAPRALHVVCSQGRPARKDDAHRKNQGCLAPIHEYLLWSPPRDEVLWFRYDTTHSGNEKE